MLSAFTEWSSGDASDRDGRLVRARERERASQTPYRNTGTRELLREFPVTIH
jgi:hypothetical protein